jgi:hypothetical protein
MTVENLVAVSPLGEYSTYEAISALLEAGVLVVDPCPPPPTADVGPAPLELRVAVSRKPVVSTWAGVAVLSLASICLGIALGPVLRSQARGFVPEAVAEARRRADHALAREVFAAVNGESPTDARLEEEQFLAPDPLEPR